MSTAFISMTEHIQQKVSAIEKFSQGDFSIEVKVISEKDQLGKSQIRMSESLNKLLLQLGMSIQQVTTGYVNSN